MIMKHLTSPTNPVIISFASKGRDDYNKGLPRLLESIREHWDGDYWLHSLEADGELPNPKAFPHRTHKERPYFFKFTMIQLLKEQGYTQIIWLDSPMVLAKNPMPLLSSGVMAFHNLGHPLKNYISDKAVHILNCANKLHDTEQTWGGAIGFDFGNRKVWDLFDSIIRAALLGAFDEGGSDRDGFIAHRHDQAVMSVLFREYGFSLHPYGTIVTSPHYLPPYEYGTDYYIMHKPLP